MAARQDIISNLTSAVPREEDKEEKEEEKSRLQLLMDFPADRDYILGLQNQQHHTCAAQWAFVNSTAATLVSLETTLRTQQMNALRFDLGSAATPKEVKAKHDFSREMRKVMTKVAAMNLKMRRLKREVSRKEVRDADGVDPKMTGLTRWWGPQQ
ncbi:MAG: hypothetical protein L6R37_006861 [Teloschistes peruensis]|nr:MAG: hypothetical protein L6R37_006861 [Teloschistes peruensis]